jgi:NAD(P)-dependent dehydrogenase (short-subunit alcohol dehydrogenase family)
MNALNGRVAIITGAGRGIGREHALLFALEGARVVVNDLGGSSTGTGADESPAEQVVAEIIAAGGEAIANHDDVTDWHGAERLVSSAIDAYGDVDILVNNAGILRDRMLANMSEEEWDSVVKVHLKGHFAPLHFAAAHWRDKAKTGAHVSASVINTSSTSGLFGNVGQANYGAAKMGIAAMTIIASKELGRYGVRVNAIAPAARTRLTAQLGGDASAAADPSAFDVMDAANISPFVAYLATESCPINGRAFLVYGGQVHLFQPWAIIDKIEKDGRWTIEELAEQGARFADVPFQLNDPFSL